MDISLGEHELTAKKSNKGNAIHKLNNLKISKVLDLISDTNAREVELQCNGSFLLRGETEDRKLKPAIIALRIIKSNRVVGVHAKLVRNASVEGVCEDIPCLRNSMEVDDGNQTTDLAGKKQFKVSVNGSFDIAIQPVTEDGVGFVPSVDSFGVTAKFCKYETPFDESDDPYLPSDYVMHGNNVNAAALFSRIERSDDTPSLGRYFRYDGVLGEEQSADGVMNVGLYEIIVSYTEMREGSQYQPKGKKKVIIFRFRRFIVHS